MEAQEGSLWPSFPRLLGLTRDAVLTALVMCHEGKDYILKQSCADLALWIIVCLGVETGLLLRDDLVHAIGSVVGYVLTHVDDMLAAGHIPILHLFVDALKEWEITQCNIIGPGREGDITYTGMWIAALSNGGFGIHQCPYVSDILKNWGVSDCKSSATLGCHDSWKQQVSTGDVPGKIPLQSDVRLAQKCAAAMLWLSTRSSSDLSYGVSRMASLCSKNPSFSLIMGKRLCRFLSGTSEHGLTLKPKSSSDGSLTVTMYGDASLDTCVGHTGLVGQINGVTVVWRSIRQSLGAFFSTIETEA